MERKPLKVMLYGDIDMNLIDGSSIWMTSVLDMLLQEATIQLTVLLKRPVIRTILLEPYIKSGKVRIIDPWTYYANRFGNETWFKRKRLLPKEAVMIMENLDNEDYFDILIVRGFNISREVAANKKLSSKTWAYITDFPQNLDSVTEEKQKELYTVYENVKYIICQTKQLESYFKKLINDNRNKYIILPPMIPDYKLGKPDFKNKNNRLVYVGKFAPLWNIEKSIDAFVKMKEKNTDIQFHVAGDKFNIDPGNGQFENELKYKLENTEGVIWHKGKSREEVQKIIEECDAGVSWRHSTLDDSLEISTKLFEYGRLGKPVIINRNSIHEELFGKDYPLYANSEEEFIEKAEEVLENPDVYEKSAKILYSICKRFTFSEVYKQLSPLLWDDTVKSEEIVFQSRIKVLFAGHDLKFAQILIDYLKGQEGYEVMVDEWQGHNRNDEAQSRKCLLWADVIICEWGLGNAVWYSKNKRAGQVMFVRMHRQELETNYPEQFELKNINKIISISPHIFEAFKRKFRFPDDKMIMIYNVIDSNKFAISKSEDSLYNLGLLGYCPSLKRLDRALDILECLWEKDEKYKLYIKGRGPEEYSWLWRREREREYYEAVYNRINQSAWRNAVVFEPWDTNIYDWFYKIGFILSVSDFESFHLAVAEGMASGSIPVILDREGADELFPGQFIFPSPDSACYWVDYILKNKDVSILRGRLQRFVRSRYDKNVIGEEWKQLIEKELTLISQVKKD